MTVDRWDERTFVVIDRIDEHERAHPIDEDWSFDERLVEPSPRTVPSTFRLAGPAGECEGSHGRAVVITTHSVPYEVDDEMLASTYRFSAVEVEASCESLFAAGSEYAGRFEWLEPRMEREFTPGRTGAEGEVILAPIGARGTFGRGYRFEDHPECDGSGPATMVVRHAGRRTRFEWGGQLAARFGLLRVGVNDYFMALGLFEWSAHPVPVSDHPGPALERLPRLTSLDVDHVEMETWVCLPPGMY